MIGTNIMSLWRRSLFNL